MEDTYKLTAELLSGGWNRPFGSLENEKMDSRSSVLYGKAVQGKRVEENCEQTLRIVLNYFAQKI